MLQLITYYKNILNKKEKKKLLLIFFLGILASVVDSLSIGLLPVYLFSIIDTKEFLISIPEIFRNFIYSLSVGDQFILYASLFVVVLFLAKNIFLYFLNVLIMILFLGLREGIMFRSAKHFVNTSYKNFLEFNSANVIRNITGESLNTSNCLRDFILLSQELSLVIFIIIFSSLLFPEIILPGIAIIFFISLCFILLTKKILKNLGEMNVKLRANFIQSVNHIFGSFKEIKIFNNEKYMLSFFKKSLSSEINNIKKINVITLVPKYMIEIFAVILISITLSYFLYQNQNIEKHIPILALFASALIKIMPSAIKISQIISKISTTYKSVEIINNLKIINLEETTYDHDNNNDYKFKFKEKISIKNVDFKYNLKRGLILSKLNFDIKKNTLTLITGASGSGKSTIIELITGILKPSNGVIEVDGINIQKNISNWQKNISYMPQDVYLLDDTIINNIMFDDKSSLSKDGVDEILKQLNLYSFVYSLPNKYEEKLGDRATTISGGQIKRFGLARCLIKKRPVIILDEPTVGLDKNNSVKLITLIKEISREHTVIVVSHNNDFEEISDNLINLSSKI